MPYRTTLCSKIVEHFSSLNLLKVIFGLKNLDGLTEFVNVVVYISNLPFIMLIFIEFVVIEFVITGRCKQWEDTPTLSLWLLMLLPLILLRLPMFGY
jgi:hypothetical protein